MRHFILVVSGFLLALPLFGQEKSPQLKDWKDKYSYNMGVQLGSRLRKDAGDINPDILAAGVKDAITMSDDQVKGVMEQYRKDMAQRDKELGEKNKTDGAKFLEENKKKPGVKTTASGLQYKVEKEGTGAQPKPTDVVTVRYHMSSTDGTEFDAYRVGRNSFTVGSGNGMKAWTEALQLMKVGSKYQVFVPPNLGYGERSSGEVGPNATLVLDIELLGVKPASTFVPGQPLVAPGASPSPK
jgi:FKBP-type peptidyl-prolyl cis-trans isomerase FklB